MKPSNDAPQRSKAALSAPVTDIPKDDRQSERVMMIYEEKYDYLCLLAIKYLNNSEVFAEDIVADVFIDALANWSSERYLGIKDLEAFICRCVINRSRNFRYRNRRLINIHDLPIDSLSTINPMMKLDLDMDGMTNMLPPKQREAFSLYCKGYTHEEIAQMLQLSSEGASKNLIYYAKKKLQKIWNELPDEDPDDPGISGVRSKGHKKASTQNKRLLSIPGNLPKIKDLLTYLSGNEQNAKVRKAILLWLVEDKYAIEIISGLNYTLNSNIGTNIEARLKKGKDNLRERLMGAIHSKKVPGNRLLLNPKQIYAAQKTRQSTKTFLNYRKDQRQKGSETLNDKNKLLKSVNSPAFNLELLSDLIQPYFLTEGFDSMDDQKNSPKNYEMNRLFSCYLFSIGIVLNKHGKTKG